MTGPIARQGPHHSAQKSTIVNLSEEITFSWKFVSVNSKAIMKRFMLCDNFILSTKIRLFPHLFRHPHDTHFFATELSLICKISAVLPNGAFAIIPGLFPGILAFSPSNE